MLSDCVRERMFLVGKELVSCSLVPAAVTGVIACSVALRELAQGNMALGRAERVAELWPWGKGGCATEVGSPQRGHPCCRSPAGFGKQL